MEIICTAGHLPPCEFAYWLQGAIEIAQISGFDKEMIVTIKRRINDVKVKDRFVFTTWLLLNLCAPAHAFAAINKELQKKFIHDIDSSYDGDQAHFQRIHDGVNDQAST
jgi:hypothetical protein